MCSRLQIHLSLLISLLLLAANASTSSAAPLTIRQKFHYSQASNEPSIDWLMSFSTTLNRVRPPAHWRVRNRSIPSVGIMLPSSGANVTVDTSEKVVIELPTTSTPLTVTFTVEKVPRSVPLRSDKGLDLSHGKMNALDRLKSQPQMLTGPLGMTSSSYGPWLGRPAFFYGFVGIQPTNLYRVGKVVTIRSNNKLRLLTGLIEGDATAFVERQIDAWYLLNSLRLGDGMRQRCAFADGTTCQTRGTRTFPDSPPKSILELSTSPYQRPQGRPKSFK